MNLLLWDFLSISQWDWDLIYPVKKGWEMGYRENLG
jgi:hypothetical protein